MRTAYVILSSTLDIIESFRLNKPKGLDKFHVCYPCDEGSYVTLKQYEKNKKPFSDLPFTIIDGVFHLNELLERMKRYEEERKQDEIIDQIITNSYCGFRLEDESFGLLKQLTPEKREEAIFRLAYRAHK